MISREEAGHDQYKHMSSSGSSGVVLSLEGAGYLCFSFPGFSLCTSAPLHAPHTRGLSEVNRGSSVTNPVPEGFRKQTGINGEGENYISFLYGMVISATTWIMPETGSS